MLPTGGCNTFSQRKNTLKEMRIVFHILQYGKNVIQNNDYRIFVNIRNLKFSTLQKYIRCKLMQSVDSKS